MKASLLYAYVILVCVFSPAFAQQNLKQNQDQVLKLEASGDTTGARSALARAAHSNPNDIAAWTAYAEFLDRYGDPAAREAYGKVLALLNSSGDKVRTAGVAHRLALLELVEGDRNAAAHNLETYRAAGGKNAALGETVKVQQAGMASIPGPIRSFARMAALSPDAGAEDILPALARNVVTNGYQASHNNEALEQTEYLKLVHRYLAQAHELEKLAGDGRVIKIETCESPAAGELLRILGFRMRGGCGSEVVLETVNQMRAFITTDSGFPINDLEQALRTNHAFNYDFHPTQVPVLFGPEYWSGPKEKEGSNFIERLYLRPFHLPSLPGFFQTQFRNRRRDAEGADADAAEGLLARAGFLRRNV